MFAFIEALFQNGHPSAICGFLALALVVGAAFACLAVGGFTAIYNGNGRAYRRALRRRAAR